MMYKDPFLFTFVSKPFHWSLFTASELRQHLFKLWKWGQLLQATIALPKFTKKCKFGIPQPCGGQDSALSLPRAWVQSLVGELRSHKPWVAVKKKKMHIDHQPKWLDRQIQKEKLEELEILIHWDPWRFFPLGGFHSLPCVDTSLFTAHLRFKIL